jgi:hypothetical protein
VTSTENLVSGVANGAGTTGSNSGNGSLNINVGASGQ